jgi:hypothetical protein
MAEAVAAFSLASNVIQVLDFGSKLTTRFWSFYKASRHATEAVPDVEKLTLDLHKILEELHVGTARSGDNDEPLILLAKECQKLAEELLNLLSSLKTVKRTGIGRIEALKSAFRAIWKEDDIAALRKRIDDFKSELTVHLLASLR